MPRRPARTTRPEPGARLAAALLALAACRPLDEAAPERASEPAPKASPAEAAAPPPARRPPAPAALPDFAAVAEHLAPSVVSVISHLPQPKGRPKRGIGSGMVVRADGLVLTNAHVVPLEAAGIDIEYADHERVAAKVLHREPLLDLAVLAPDPPRVDQPPVVFRERDVRPGAWVMALGHPFGLGDTVTVGVISGLGRDHIDLGKPAEVPAEGFWSFIQTDASINTGNSGGPLVDQRGEVIGVATAVRSEGQGLGFAVPAPMARRYLEEVLAHGRFRRVRLGINVQDADDFPGRLATVHVTKVDPAGAGARAGLEPDDYILAISGQPVTRVSEVAYLTQLLGVDAQIELQVQRAGEAVRALTLAPVEGR